MGEDRSDRPTMFSQYIGELWTAQHEHCGWIALRLLGLVVWFE